jgi:hypothetical protein
MMLKTHQKASPTYLTILFAPMTTPSSSFMLPKNHLQKDLDDFDIYGVDPGHRHLFIAINREGVTQRFSNNEWCAKSGVKRRSHDQQERKKESGL